MKDLMVWVGKACHGKKNTTQNFITTNENKITTQKHWYESVFLPYIATKYYDRKVIYEYCIQDLDTDWGGPSVRSHIL